MLNKCEALKLMPLEMYQKKNQSASKIKHIIAIAAGKGGVGKSTVTVNLALSLKKLGKSVGILDTDIYGPSVRMMLPEDLMPVQKGEQITPALCKGIPMISMAYFRPDNQAAVVRAPIANGIVKQFLKNVVWGDLDYLFIDFPPGTGDIQLTLSQEAQLTAAIMVTTPQNVAVMDVRKAMDMFTKVRIPILGIVENMSYYQDAKTDEKMYIFGKDGGLRLSSEAGVPFLQQIPLNSKICECGDLGKSLFENGETPASHAFMQLGKEVIRQVEILHEQSKHSVQSFNLKWKEM